jgi:hypothetical protein
VNLAHEEGGDPIVTGDLAVKHQASSTDLRGRSLEDSFFGDLDLFGEELVTDRNLGREFHELTTLGITLDGYGQCSLLETGWGNGETGSGSLPS